MIKIISFLDSAKYMCKIWYQNDYYLFFILLSFPLWSTPLQKVLKSVEISLLYDLLKLAVWALFLFHDRAAGVWCSDVIG